MTLVARTVREVSEHALGGPLAAPYGGFTVSNQAARLMEDAYEWRYLRKTTQALLYRPEFSGLAAVYDTPTKSLTLVGAFTTYVYVPGDTVTITISGSSFGTYRVSSRASDDSIILDTDLSAGTVSVDFTMETGRIGLPSDFGRLIQLEGKDSFLTRTFASTPSEILRLQTSATPGAGYSIAYAVEWQTSITKSQPVATLRMWPTPTGVDREALGATYSREWPDITSDADILPLPPYMEALYFQYVRAVSTGYEGAGSKGASALDLTLLVETLRGSRLFTDAADRDAATHPAIEILVEGAIRRTSPPLGFDPLAVGSDARLFNS